MYVVCNVTYVLVEYSAGLHKELNYVLLSLPAIYLLYVKQKKLCKMWFFQLLLLLYDRRSIKPVFT